VPLIVAAPSLNVPGEFARGRGNAPHSPAPEDFMANNDKATPASSSTVNATASAAASPTTSGRAALAAVDERLAVPGR
jgi:hypothetical protein